MKQKPAGNSDIEMVEEMNTSQEMFEKRVDDLRKKVDQHLALAKQANSQGNKDEALLNFRRKKVYEREIKTLEANILKIKKQKLLIERVSEAHEFLEHRKLKTEGASVAQHNYDVLRKNQMATVTKGMDPVKLEERVDDLRKKVDQHLALAKQALSQGNKDGALLYIKRKKMYEKKIEYLEAVILTIEEQTLIIEGTAQDVYEALQTARNTMAVVINEMDPEKLQEDFGEVQSILDDNAIMEMEDPDLLEELEQLDSDHVEENAFDLRLPAVTKKEDGDLLKEVETLVAPTHTPIANKPKPVTNTAEEEELAQFAQLLV